MLKNLSDNTKKGNTLAFRKKLVISLIPPIPLILPHMPDKYYIHTPYLYPERLKNKRIEWFTNKEKKNQFK